MRTYVVAYFDYFDGELEMEKVSANSEKEALIVCRFINNAEEAFGSADILAADIINYISECDAAISIIEV